MSLFEDAMSVAVQLPQADRERLAQALGVKLAPKNTLNLSMNSTLPMATQDRSKTDPQGWRKAETGHAVLDTGGTVNIEAGPKAIRGIWSHLDLPDNYMDEVNSQKETVSALPKGSPVLVHTSVVVGLTLDIAATKSFWESPQVEIRLATGTYLKLLESCENEEQLQRVKAFVQPYAVLSLGPMASSRSVQLMLEGGAQNGLTALDALIAATAIAHEIPLVTRTPRMFEGIDGLQIATLP
jgi:predicted nucleic acid-binding protein